MLPKPPELWRNNTQEISDGELFYVTNYGVRMTGIPAFGPNNSEKEIWNIVSIVRKLDKLTISQQEQLPGAAGLYQKGEPPPEEQKQ